MNLRDLEYFVAVAEIGQFNGAAKRCFVSQPTLSGQLKKLEEELGHPLFERTTRTVQLTSFGKEALPLAQSALEMVATIEKKAQARNDPFAGEISLGAFPTLGPWFLPRISQMLHRKYPNIAFYLREDKTKLLLSQLQEGELDAAFIAYPVDIPQLNILPLFSEVFQLAIPTNHPWKKRRRIRTAELKNQELLLLEDGHCLRDQTLDLCHKYGAHEKGYVQATGLETLRQMIRMEQGITLIPAMAIPDHQEPGIRYIQLDSQDAKRDIGLCFRTTHPRRALFDHLAKKLRRFCASALPVEILAPTWQD